MQTNDSRNLSYQCMLVNGPNVSGLDMEVMHAVIQGFTVGNDQ